MHQYQTLCHSKWECKYHVVFIPKYRRKILYGQLRQHLGEVFKRLAEQKESRVEEGHLMPDHVHMLISIPPKYAVAQVIGYVKGKSAIHIARTYGERKRNFVGEHFWARGYFVTTAGRDEEVVREYIRRQENEDLRLEAGPVRLALHHQVLCSVGEAVDGALGAGRVSEGREPFIWCSVRSDDH